MYVGLCVVKEEVVYLWRLGHAPSPICVAWVRDRDRVRVRVRVRVRLRVRVRVRVRIRVRVKVRVVKG